MARKHSQECSCWVPYPNVYHKKRKHCKCDDYINISQVVHPYKKKTHCIRKDVIYGFNKKGGAE